MRTLILPGLIALLALAGCGEAPKTAAPSPAPVAPAETRFPLAVSGKILRVRVALTELEQETGLMHTTSLPADEGMIFVYRDASRRAFWMPDVPYDIDLGYFDAAGHLDETVLLHANDTTPVPSKSEKIRYALEAPAGWFVERNLAPGAQLDLSVLAKAAEARGFRAKDFIDEK